MTALDLVNQQGTQNGCPPVAFNPELSAAATLHGLDMLESGATGHTGSDGAGADHATVSVTRRLEAAGHPVNGGTRPVHGS